MGVPMILTSIITAAVVAKLRSSKTKSFRIQMSNLMKRKKAEKTDGSTT